MIVAHHVGEELIPSLLAAGTAAVPVSLVIVRARLGRLARAFRRPRTPR